MQKRWSQLLTKLAAHRFLLTIGVLLVALVIRSWNLLMNPPSLYWEERALLYDAWSIVQTGRDVHGQWLPLVAFESYGDYKPSGYFYAVAVLIQLFGKSEIIVRLPSVIAGIASVWLTGKIAGLLFVYQQKKYWWWELLVMLLATFNPALWQLSRGGWETNLATAYLLAGIYFLLKAKSRTINFQVSLRSLVRSSAKECGAWCGARQKSAELGTSSAVGQKSKSIFFVGHCKKLLVSLPWSVIIGEIFLLLSFYTYHATRVVAPLLGIYLATWRWCLLVSKYHWRWQRILAEILVVMVIALLGSGPLLYQLLSPAVADRFQTTSMLQDIDLISQSNQCRVWGGETLLARWWCHRYWYFARAIIQNLTSHFNWDYLFFHGDHNPRHSIQFFGVYYPLEMLALVLALVFASKNWHQNRSTWWFLSFWLLVGLLPASVTYGTPHLLRTLTTVPVGVILVAVGWREFLSWWQPRWRGWCLASVATIYLGMITMWAFYNHAYYPRAFAHEWQSGYREGMWSLAMLQERFPQLPVYITRSLGRPAYYYFYYHDIAPRTVQAVASEQKYDQSEFLTFTPDQVNFGTGWLEQEQLFMLTPDEAASLAATPEATIINDAAGTAVLVVGHYVPMIPQEQEDEI